MNIDPLALQAALIGLRQRYPTDTVAAWWEWPVGEPDHVTFRLHCRDDIGLPNAWGHGATLESALAALFVDAGERDPVKLRQAKIAQLRDQLAKLQALDQPAAKEATV